MDAWARLCSTVAIWLAFMITAVVLIAEQGARHAPVFTEPVLFALMALLVLGAVAATRVVWLTFQPANSADDQAAQAKAKRSHHRRLARLAGSLDADELADLEAMVLARKSERDRR